MAEQKPDAKEKVKCAQTGVILKKVKRYYRNGKYYISKAAFKTKAKADQDKAAAAKEEPAAA